MNSPRRVAFLPPTQLLANDYVSAAHLTIFLTGLRSSTIYEDHMDLHPRNLSDDGF